MKKYLTILNEAKDSKQANTLESLITSNNKYVKLLSPSIKEWPNSVYTFNKSDLEPSYHKNEVINKIMRNYFNLTVMNKNNKNSKRMRDLIRRSSTNKLFVSNTEIKHTADKIIYTVYVFNKEKNFFAKKIYLLNKSFNKFNKYTIYSMKYLNTHLHNNINQELYTKLNKVRPINRLGTINTVSEFKSGTGHMVNKSYMYNPIRKNFSKNLFLNKTTKSIIYYVNSYNVVKKQPLLQLKTNKQIKTHKKLMYRNMKQSLVRTNFVKQRGYATNPNLFLSADQKTSKSLLFNKIGAGQSYFSKKIAWRNLLKNKNNNYFSNKLLGLLTLSFNKKQTKLLKSILFFNFAKWVLSGFNIKITITKKKLVITKQDNQSLLNVKNKTEKINNLIGTYSLPYFFNNTEVRQESVEKKRIKSKLVTPIEKLIKIKLLNKRKINRLVAPKLRKLRKFSKKRKVLDKLRLKMIYKIKLNRLNTINNILFKLIVVVMKKGEVINNDYLQSKSPDFNFKNIEYLFRTFKSKYLKDILKTTVIKQLLGILYLYKQSMEGFKYNRFLVALKMALLRVYNKNPQINIVNLKYLHLNSDLLLEAIAIKLKNKKTNLLRTLKKALKLVKLPRGLKDNTTNITTSSHHENKTINFNDTNLTKTPISNDSLQDILGVSLNKMFFEAESTPKDVIKVSEKKTNNLTNIGSNEIVKGIYAKRKNKLDSLRYKWITGVKIEGKGRLTKRYRADRSLFKLKHKGSLKNINFKDIYNKNHLSLRKTQSMMLLKGQTTPNIQYSFAKWKRHIGSYGIKGWISSN